jgi:hypothetical protein
VCVCVFSCSGCEVNLTHLSSWGQVAFNSLKNVQLATGMWTCLSCDANPLLKLVDCMNNMLCMWSARGGKKNYFDLLLLLLLLLDMLPPLMKQADNKNRESKDYNLQQYPLCTTLLHCLQPPAFSSPGHCSLLILEASDRPPCQRHLRRKKRSSRVEIEAAESQSWALMVVECEVSSQPPCL